MRRWTVTLGLTATAAAALLVAPRLLPGPVVGFVPIPAGPQLPREAPPVPVATLPDPIPAVSVPRAVIPEVVDSPAVEPDPLPDEFWHDAVDCGMG